MRSRFDTLLWDAQHGLQHEVELLGATEIVISANVTLTKGGWLAAQQNPTEDAGVAVYFSRDGGDLVMACDR
jgi:hypothetical protein